MALIVCAGYSTSDVRHEWLDSTYFELFTLPNELEDANRKYGVPLTDIKRLVERWKSGHDCRRHEKELNDELPMFTRDIDVVDFGTLNTHYVHKKSTVANAIPCPYVGSCV